MALHQRQAWEKTCAQTTESGFHPGQTHLPGVHLSLLPMGLLKSKGPPECLEGVGRDV